VRTFIFACVHSAGRSQMSAAFFNQLVDPALARGISAGMHPADRVHPVVVDTMREVGIDLSAAKPQKLTAELAQNGEMLVTMGCGDDSPYVPGLRRDDWPLPDPKGQGLESVRQNPRRDQTTCFGSSGAGAVEHKCRPSIAATSKLYCGAVDPRRGPLQQEKHRLLLT
jgi:arsenate reductase (thioredoxin)